MSEFTSAFDCWEALVDCLTAAGISSATTVEVDVGFGWPLNYIGLESVKVTGMLDTDEREQTETFSSYRERPRATVLVTTAIGHADATTASRRLAQMVAEVQYAVNATKRPDQTTWPRIKAWRASFDRATVFPHERGWVGQAELTVTFTAHTRSAT